MSERIATTISALSFLSVSDGDALPLAMYRSFVWQIAMIIAAETPLPDTSPTTIPSLPSGSSMKS